MSDKVRVRFAPSPTGHLHIGGARTALFNYLYSKSMGGKFILRIEDTDTTRSTDEYIQSIMDGMRWLGLDWDEGPYRQTDRFDIYAKYAEKLLAEDKAYKCYCTPEELEQRRLDAQQKGQTPAYDRRCRILCTALADKPYSIRFKMPLNGTISVKDMVKGTITFENSQLDDLIIVRSDGTPTYNFVVVVDDVDMAITHVIRGDDHLNNTPKQIYIYRALGYELPVFAHLPMILGADKSRLSKRHGATSVIAYRDDGYLADALLNYLVRLGWSYCDREVFSKEELIGLFSFDTVGKSASVFNPEKLLWLNAEHMKLKPLDAVCTLVRPFLAKDGILPEDAVIDSVWLQSAVKTLVERSKTLLELASGLSYYISDKITYDDKARAKFLKTDNLNNLKEALAIIETTTKFTAHEIETEIKQLAEKLGVKLGSIAQPMRVAITGRAESPGIFDVLEVVGKDKAVMRIRHAIAAIESES